MTKRVSKIIKAQEGPVILKGKVQKFEKLISAPLSKKLCCGYFYLVEDKRNVDKIVHSENLGTDFILDDGTGRCLIRSNLAAGDFYNAALWPPTIRFSNVADLEEAIKKNDLCKYSLGRRYRHLEYRRQEGEAIYVKGLYQLTLKNVNVDLFRLNGEIIGDTKNASPTIIPAYSGSTFSSSNRGHWLNKIMDAIVGAI